MTCNKKIYFSRKRSDLHESQLNLKLLNSVSHSLSDLDEISTELLRRPALREVANSFLSKTRPNLIIHPKSQGSAQEWGNANFINFTNELVKLDFCHIMITGTKAEGELLAKDFFPHLSDEAKMKIKNTCGLLSLKELIELISHAQMIMANSTGPLHLGSLFGLKTVGLFPGDDQRPMHAGRWRPIGLNVSIFKPLNGQHLQTVSPEVVIGKIKQWECK